jgi:hypothetical protein
LADQPGGGDDSDPARSSKVAAHGVIANHAVEAGGAGNRGIAVGVPTKP